MPIHHKQDSETGLESKISTNSINLLLKFFFGLPKIWKAKIRSRELIKIVPEYNEQLQIPGSDEIFNWIKGLCQTPHRRPGTPEGHKAEQWVATQLKELGLDNVRMDPIPIQVWSATNWSLEVNGHEIPSFFIVNTGFTPKDGITAPLIYVGEGRAKDFKKDDVSGKIVVADVPFPYIPTGLLVKFLQILRAAYIISDPDHSISLRSGQYLNFVRQNFLGDFLGITNSREEVYWQAFRRKAKGICLILKDQPSNSNTHYGPYDGILKPLPGLWIGKYDGIELRKYAKAGAIATLVLEGSVAPGKMHNIWGMLPGKSEEVVMITSHHDAPFQGAIEDGAGVAQVLAQVKIWSEIPQYKRARTLIFVIGAGHFYGSQGGLYFARAHRDLMKKVKIVITLEHLGGKEVTEQNQQYVETKNLALTVMFTSHHPHAIAAVVNALKKNPAKRTLPIPSDFFTRVPVSDAAGYVLETGVPVISWIGCPYYLLDAHDTLDKVAIGELAPICRTITELVKPFM
ncbi:MAG: M28 family peptidase [Candidatus Helarchaeota archaeon]